MCLHTCASYDYTPCVPCSRDTVYISNSVTNPTYTGNTEITKGVPECDKRMYIYDTIKWYDDTDR